MFSLMFTIGLLCTPPAQLEPGYHGSLTSSSFSRLLHTELISQPEISLESRHFRRPEPHLMQETPTLPPPCVHLLRAPSPTVRTTPTRRASLEDRAEVTSSPTPGCSPATKAWRAWLEVTTGTTTPRGWPRLSWASLTKRLTRATVNNNTNNNTNNHHRQQSSSRGERRGETLLFIFHI